jgi:hypothetical protein
VPVHPRPAAAIDPPAHLAKKEKEHLSLSFNLANVLLPRCWPTPPPSNYFNPENKLVAFLNLGNVFLFRFV